MIKKMDLNEFYELGLLQELNRKFLHPMGLALEVIIDQESGNVLSFGGVWDYRDDLEGLLFPSTSDKKFIDKAETVERLFKSKKEYRLKNRGYFIQPLNLDVDKS